MTGCHSSAREADQNGVFPQYIMLEIHHSGREPSKSYLPTVMADASVTSPTSFWSST